MFCGKTNAKFEISTLENPWLQIFVKFQLLVIEKLAKTFSSTYCRKIDDS